MILVTNAKKLAVNIAFESHGSIDDGGFSLFLLFVCFCFLWLLFVCLFLFLLWEVVPAGGNLFQKDSGTMHAQYVLGTAISLVWLE